MSDIKLKNNKYYVSGRLLPAGTLFYIKKCIKENINSSILLDEYYTPEQSREIYLGLKAGLDISFYSSPKFNEEQMKNIREGLLIGIDVSVYADTMYNAGQMKALKETLIHKTFLPEFANKSISEEALLIYHKMILEKIDTEFIKKLIARNTSADVLRIIRRMNETFGNKYNDLIASYKLKSDTIKNIYKLITEDESFGCPEIFEIFESDVARKNSIASFLTECLEAGVSIEKCKEFVNGRIKEKELSQLKNEELSDSIINGYIYLKISNETGVNLQEEYDLEILDKSLELGIDLTKVVTQGYDNDCLEEICYAIEDNVKNILSLINSTMSSKEIFEIRNKAFISNKINQLNAQKLKNKKNIEDYFKIEYINNTWNIFDKNDKLFYKSYDVHGIFNKLEEYTVLLKQNLTTEEIYLTTVEMA